MILAVDTTGDYGSIALLDGETLREEVPLHEPRGYSHVLFAEIEALLSRQAVRLKDVTLFAAASGPGSFTGVRIGLAAVKGLAEVLGCPAAPVSNLRAVASFGTGTLRAAVIDAHRGEFYCGLFDGAGNPVGAEAVLPLEKFLAQLPATTVEWISADIDSIVPLIGERFAGDTAVRAPKALAAAIARLAPLCAAPPEAVEANYVRRSDAEMFWKEM